MKHYILPFVLGLLLAFANQDAHAQSITTNNDGTYYNHPYDGNWELNQLQSSYLPDHNFYLYPNPVVSQARIELPYPSFGRVQVQVIDLRGEIVRSFMYGPGSYQMDVDMSTVPIGYYNLRVIEWGKGGRNIHNIKVMKTN